MKTTHTFQTGLSLVELMIAMTLGLIVSGTVATIFLQSKASYTQNDEINYIQDNGRYALNAIAHDLEVADFWGGIVAPDAITFETNPVVDDYLVGGFECGKATKSINSVLSWTYDATNAINYHTSPDPSVVAVNYPCVAGFQTDSDFLTVKRVRGLGTTALEAHKVYLYSDGSDGQFHTNSVALSGTQTAWEYYANLYYIKDNNLIKMYLGWDDINSEYAMFETELAEGIERFHVVFGIDNGFDTTADYYTSSPTPTELEKAVYARIYVLARASKEINGYTNAKSYELGDVTISYLSNTDGYYRRVFSTSVVLRNARIINRISENI